MASPASPCTTPVTNNVMVEPSMRRKRARPPGAVDAGRGGADSQRPPQATGLCGRCNEPPYGLMVWCSSYCNRSRACYAIPFPHRLVVGCVRGTSTQGVLNWNSAQPVSVIVDSCAVQHCNGVPVGEGAAADIGSERRGLNRFSCNGCSDSYIKYEAGNEHEEGRGVAAAAC